MERVYTKVKGKRVFLGFSKRSISRNSTSWGTEKLREKGVKIIRLSFLDTGEVLERFQKHAFFLRLPGKEENFGPAQAF